MPQYTPWSPGQPNQQLECALDGLRQGELWLCDNLRRVAEMTANDLHDREVLIEQQRERITVLEAALREQASAVQQLVARDADLLELRAQLLGAQKEQNRSIAALGGQVTNFATHLADANKQWCQRLDDLMKDVLAIRGDMETQRLDNGGALFVNGLCDELLRMATVLRAPEIAQALPASTDLERCILAAQEVARVLRSPGSLAGGVSMPASSRHHSPAPSVGSRALG